MKYMCEENGVCAYGKCEHYGPHEHTGKTCEHQECHPHDRDGKKKDNSNARLVRCRSVRVMNIKHRKQHA